MSEHSDKPGLPEIDVREWGGKKDGERQSMDRRLFMQLLVFDCPQDRDPDEPVEALIAGLREAGVGAVVYDDVNAPLGVGLLSWSDDPAFFAKRLRPVFRDARVRVLRPRPDHTMIGRTYGSGYEPNLEHWLLSRPVDNVLAEENRFAVWYPLRRSGAFARLDKAEQSAILREHAAIGLAYGQKGLATDVRLACYGIDARDNEFVIGLIGKDLHPLSHVVQTMRGTRQTSEFIVSMGPFFTGLVRWRSAGGAR